MVTAAPHRAVLHYIFDPLCGWCYGAAPLVKIAREMLPVVAHGGGMMSGARRQSVSPAWRVFVMPHDRRIAELTGQPFGEAYFDGLLRDDSAVFDSVPPTAAMLAAEQQAGRGLDMLARLQTAHYVEGRRIADRPVQVDAAVALGLNREGFERALEAAEGPVVQAHVDATRALMARLGVGGFPAMAIESDAGFVPLDIGPFLGRPDAFAAWLRPQVPERGQATPQAAASSAFACTADSCSPLMPSQRHP